MIINSNIDGPGRPPVRARESKLIASIDVEWTKNYKIKNGNVPFCWSVVWLHLAASSTPPKQLAVLPFAYTSLYVIGPGETQDLIDAADTEFGMILRTADYIIGHQISSDLAVLRNASRAPVPNIETMRKYWHARRNPNVGRPTFLDTRYDIDEVLSCTSRRLVDVCADLDLDVTQPELIGTSMTALHKVWLVSADDQARERITILNLRHGLSAAYVALRGAGLGEWSSLNVNEALHRQLNGRFAWLRSPTFLELL